MGVSIKFADMTEEREEKVPWDVRSVFTMTLLQLDYLVHSLSNCVMTVLPTETDLMRVCMIMLIWLALGALFGSLYSHVYLFSPFLFTCRISFFLINQT